ncbi:MAG TPA: carboxypeptidase-like regulatory domain-containing protein [Gemmataceae bacterium]|jgi:hypothetical protein|nr:carboxypeptidase-like regulatory domain-containing protein [Gemmataceae bacterium]
MRSRLSFAAVMAVSLLMFAGCGGLNGRYPVSGKVVYNGEPAVGAMVIFVSKDAPSQTHQGVVGEDGTFTLAGPAGDGALPGEYTVLVEWKEGAGKSRGRSPGLSAPDRLKKRYLDPKKPLLTATVEAKTNNLPPFELK